MALSDTSKAKNGRLYLLQSVYNFFSEIDFWAIKLQNSLQYDIRKFIYKISVKQFPGKIRNVTKKIVK